VSAGAACCAGSTRARDRPARSPHCHILSSGGASVGAPCCAKSTRGWGRTTRGWPQSARPSRCRGSPPAAGPPDTLPASPAFEKPLSTTPCEMLKHTRPLRQVCQVLHQRGCNRSRQKRSEKCRFDISFRSIIWVSNHLVSIDLLAAPPAAFSSEGSSITRFDDMDPRQPCCAGSPGTPPMWPAICWSRAAESCAAPWHARCCASATAAGLTTPNFTANLTRISAHLTVLVGVCPVELSLCSPRAGVPACRASRCNCLETAAEVCQQL